MARRRLRQRIQETRARQDHGRRRILQDERQPLPRVRRIEGHVGAARLEDPEDRHDQLR